MKKTAACIVSALAIMAHAPANAADISGQWRCQSSVVALDNSMQQANDFSVVFYPDGRFEAQGLASAVGANALGSGQLAFSAQGGWQVVNEGGVISVLMSGTQTYQTGLSQNFAFGSHLHTSSMMALELTQNGYQSRSNCRR